MYWQNILNMLFSAGFGVASICILLQDRRLDKMEKQINVIREYLLK